MGSVGCGVVWYGVVWGVVRCCGALWGVAGCGVWVWVTVWVWGGGGVRWGQVRWGGWGIG